MKATPFRPAPGTQPGVTVKISALGADPARASVSIAGVGTWEGCRVVYREFTRLRGPGLIAAHVAYDLYVQGQHSPDGCDPGGRLIPPPRRRAALAAAVAAMNAHAARCGKHFGPLGRRTGPGGGR